MSGRRAILRGLSAASLLLAACRSTPVVAPAPATTNVPSERAAPMNSPSVKNEPAPAVTPRAAPTTDDVAHTVVSVFGDTAALHPDSAPGADAEPVWDIDVRSYETHDRVAHYVDLFTNGAREHFQQRLSRGTRYEPMIRAKMRASGMPEDMTYLALIESGYDPNAYSRAAAVGMWQFMSSTARDAGLRVDWWMDERRDPVRSTDAAIKFLGELKAQFGSLYLAAAAYNGGPGRIARGLSRFADELEGKGAEDRFFALAEHDYLRAETRNYVPQLIAAALVAKVPAKYGVTLDSVAPLSYDTLRAPPGTSLAVIANVTDVSPAALRDLNPALLRGITPPDSAIWVHVPTGTATGAAERLDSLSEESRAGFRTTRATGKTPTLASIASREGITVKQLMWFNPTLKTTKKGRIAEGQSVRVPVRAVLAYAREIPDPSIERWGGSQSAALRRGGFHVVRRGESIGTIADRYGISVSRLRALNGLRGTRVIPGQTLRVASRTSSASSATKSSKSPSTTSKAAAKSSNSAKPSKAAKPSSSKAKSSKTAGAKKSSAKSSKGSGSKKKSTSRSAASSRRPS